MARKTVADLEQKIERLTSHLRFLAGCFIFTLLYVSCGFHLLAQINSH